MNFTTDLSDSILSRLAGFPALQLETGFFSRSWITLNPDF